MSTALPIDEIIPALLAAVETHPFLVLEAAPGAGKTTRVPVAIQEAREAISGQVIVTEPRRIAARLAASFVARELGSSVGGKVGYSVRFEERTSAATRIRYVTEGVLLQQLVQDPWLSGAHTVILDEFHERHLATDQLLALLLAASERRPELRVIVMSATLDAAPIAAFLDECPRLVSEGRKFPLEIRHQRGPDDRPLEKRVASAVKAALAERDQGHVLVFLPGSREIRAAERSLERYHEHFDLHILHGELPMAQQAAAVASSRRRKVILATNVAESSVTIDGVTAVVDSGLARVAGHSAFTGRSTLQVAPISQSSAIQRAGRAGRTSDGLVVRLYEEQDYKRRIARPAPEIERSDLAPWLLQLAGMGRTPDELRWLTPPKAEAVTAAHTLLCRLGALDARGSITERGRRMLLLPVAPRLAAVVVRAADYGVQDDACLAAALLSERDIRRTPKTGTWDLPDHGSDIEERIEAYREAEYERFRGDAMRRAGLEPQRVNAVTRAYKQLTSKLRRARLRGPHDLPGGLNRCLLSGFSDRVALHQPKSRRLILKDGGVAKVSELSVVRHAPYVLALEVEERDGPGGSAARVQWLCAIEPDWLLEDYEDEITTQDELVYSAERQRVESVSRLAFGSVTLEESRLPAPASPQAAALLFDAAQQQRTQLLGKHSELDQLAQRIALLRAHGFDGQLPDTDRFLPDRLLEGACGDHTTMAELRDVEWVALALSELSFEQQALLREAAPDFVTLPCGRRLQVHYDPGKPPWIETRLQDFFGMAEGPTICRGRVALTLHLLAPNRRAVQVTSDLAGFWERHYSEVRKELRRRYAKHSWPEDGRTAEPPPLRKIR